MTRRLLLLLFLTLGLLCLGATRTLAQTASLAGDAPSVEISPQESSSPETSPEAPTETPIKTSVEAPKLKVAFAFYWTIDDQGWSAAHYRGMQYLQKTLGEQVETAFTENVQAADAERVLRSYASKGYDLIFGTSPDHLDALLRVAQDFPDIKFENCGGFSLRENVGSYDARMYQAEYLAGYLAGLLGFHDAGTLGILPQPQVLPQTLPQTLRQVDAFTLGQLKGLRETGAEYDPERVNTVVWLYSWRDPAKEATLTETLVAGAHDLIRSLADGPDSSLAACAKGVATMGHGSDVGRFGADCALLSTLANWGPYYVDTARRLLEGSWTPRITWGGFAENALELSAFNPGVPEAVQGKVLAELDKLMAGQDTVFVGPIHDQKGALRYAEGERPTDEELLNLRFLVQGVSGVVPE